MKIGLPHITKLPMHVTRLQTGLQRRVDTLPRGGSTNSCILLVLTDGEAFFDFRGGEAIVTGPAVAWRRMSSESHLTLQPGSTGYLAEIAEETVARAIGDFFESAALQMLFESNWARSLEETDHATRALARTLDGILEEQARPQAGTGMMIVAHLRIILVTILRATGVDEVARITRGNNAHHLQRFRQLLEAGFRSHQPVGYYATELGITHDRLHAICMRELGKTPKALVAERLAREAVIGLERSTLSIKQLSYALGFRDPAHFSNFFRRMTGLSPGRFRKMTASTPADAEGFAPPSFADWP